MQAMEMENFDSVDIKNKGATDILEEEAGEEPSIFD